MQVKKGNIMVRISLFMPAFIVTKNISAISYTKKLYLIYEFNSDILMDDKIILKTDK